MFTSHGLTDFLPTSHFTPVCDVAGDVTGAVFDAVPVVDVLGRVGGWGYWSIPLPGVVLVTVCADGNDLCVCVTSGH